MFKMLKIFKIFKKKKCYFNKKSESSTSVPGGNLVDGLPAAPSENKEETQRGEYLEKNKISKIMKFVEFRN